MNLRWINIDEPKARTRATLDYRVTPRFTLGLEVNGEAEEVLPRATWFVSPEAGGLPSVALGFTADRLSTPKGEAVFLTFAKAVPKTPLTPFASVKYWTHDRRFSVPFGANLRLGPGTIQGLYDGNHTHLIWSQPVGGANVSLVLARMKHLGVAVSFGF